MDMQVIVRAARRMVLPALFAGITVLGITGFSSVASADPTGGSSRGSSYSVKNTMSTTGHMHMDGRSGESTRGTVHQTAPTKYLRQRSAR